LYRGSDGKILIGGHGGLISSYDFATNKFFNEWPAGVNHKTVLQFIPDQLGNIWMQMWFGGVVGWNQQKNNFKRFPSLDPYFGPDTSVSTIFIDSKNYLWVSIVANGILKVNTSSGKCEKHFLHKAADPFSISADTYNCMAEINDSLLAFGGRNVGVDIFNVNKDRVEKAYNLSNGLEHGDIEALYFQPPDFLWATSHSSISKINLRTNHVTNFAEEDGISNVHFDEGNGFFKLRDGRLLASHQDGLFCFDPLGNSDERIPDDPMITGFSVFDKQLNLDSVFEKSDTITLSYQQNFFTIRFASINYINPERISYYYKLENVDKEWFHAGPEHSAQYTNLAGGKYLFQVKCENNDGKFSRHIRSVFIIIDPPFWQTIWFYFSVTACLIGGLYLLYRYRINQLRQLQAVRNKISRDLHDDLGATLSSISVLSDVIKKNVQFEPGDENYSLLTKINSYSREMVDRMRDIVWAVNPSNDNMEMVIQRLRNYAAETCTPKEIQVNFDVGHEVGKMSITMNSRKSIFLICKEAIHNAAKHSGCDTINILIRYTSPELIIEITDNGRGFSKEPHMSGNGLINMSERAKEIRANLTIQSAPTGTHVQLRVAVPRFRG
jgi:hypothetical protein